VRIPTFTRLDLFKLPDDAFFNQFVEQIFEFLPLRLLEYQSPLENPRMELYLLLASEIEFLPILL